MNLVRSSLFILKALIRKRRHWAGAAALTFLAAILTTLFLVTTATRLTPLQLTESSMGNAQYLASAPGDDCAPSTCKTAQKMTESLEFLGATNIRTISSTSQISLEHNGTSNSAVDITEAPWTNHFHPETYQLVEGRWPDSPEEIVVTDDSALGLDLGSKTSFYGHTEVTVVGIVDVVHIPSSTSVLSAPGLIDRIYKDLQSQGNQYATPAVQTDIRWDGPGLSKALPPLATAVAQAQGLDETSALSTLEKSASERHEEPHKPWTWFFETPALWGIAPVLITTFFMGVMAVIPNRDLIGRITRQLSFIGISDSFTTLMAALYRSALLAFSVALGTVIGYFFSLALRPSLEKIIGHVLSPSFFPFFFAATIFALSFVFPFLTAACYFVWPLLKKGILWLNTPLGKKILFIALMAGSTIASFWALRGISTAGDSYDKMTHFIVTLAVVGAVLIAALITWTLKWEPPVLSITLPWRRMRSQNLLSGAVALLANLAVIIPLTLGISLTTASFYGSLKETGSVPPGSIALGENHINYGGVPKKVAEEFSEYTGVHNPAEVYITGISTSQGDGIALGVESQKDVERLIGRPLNANESQTWENGGLLAGNNRYEDQKTVKVEKIVDIERSDIREIPVTVMESTPKEYSESYVGFISLKAAQEFDGEMLAPYYIYTDASPEQVDAAKRAPEALDFEPRWVEVFETPEFSGPSREITVLAGALAATLLVAVIALARVLSSRLRPYGTALVTLGLGPHILGRTLAITLGYLVLLPLLLGSVTAIGANAWGWSMLAHGYTIMVPWGWVLMYSAAICAVVLATIMIFTISVTRSQHEKLP